MSEQELVEYMAESDRASGGLLLNPLLLKNDKDLLGWEVRPVSFLQTCKVTIMTSSREQTAVPCLRGSAGMLFKWTRVRDMYMAQKEEVIKRLHYTAADTLKKLLLNTSAIISALDAMTPGALYLCAHELQRTLASVNKVVAPIFSWVQETKGTAKKALDFLQKQSELLDNILCDMQVTDVAKKILGISTFFARRSDFKAVLELSERLLLVQACLGEAMPEDVARQVPEDVARTRQLPNEYELVRSMAVFRGEADAAEVIGEIARKLRLLLFTDSSCIIRAQTAGVKMYIVNHGSCVVSVGGREVAEVGRGGYFGEIALLSNSRLRTADVHARGLVEVWELGRKDLVDALRTRPHLLARIDSDAAALRARACAVPLAAGEANSAGTSVACRVLQEATSAGTSAVCRALQAEEAVRGAAGVAPHESASSASGEDDSGAARLKMLFQPAPDEVPEDGVKWKLTEAAWLNMLAGMQRVAVRKGGLIFGAARAEAEGAPQAGLYILQSGEANVFVCGETRVEKTHVEALGPGAFFGESTLLLAQDPLLAVEATTDCSLLVLSSPDLCAILDEYPILYRNLLQVAALKASSLRPHTQ